MKCILEGNHHGMVVCVQITTLQDKITRMEKSQQDLERTKKQMKKKIQELKSDRSALAMQNEVIIQQMAEVNHDVRTWLHLEEDPAWSNLEKEHAEGG